MNVVVITGAAGGIGQALVRAFASANYVVIGVDRAPKPALLPCEHYLTCDLLRTVTEPDYAAAVFTELRTIFASRPLAALVNNAAVQILGSIEDLRLDDWYTTLDVNLLAPFVWAQALLPELTESHGCIVNVSSIHSRLTKPNFIAYATSKAALSGMTRAMAVELGSRVRVTAVEPAAISTDMLLAGFEGDSVGLTRLRDFHPTETLGTPEGLAKQVLLLVSSADAFSNGCILQFDGGIGARLHDPA